MPDSTPPARRYFVGILLIFMLAGPFFGGLAMSFSLSLLAANSEFAAATWLDGFRLLISGTLIGSLFFLPITYAFGIIPASLIGLGLALWHRRTGTFSRQVCVVASLVSAGVALLLTGALTEDGVRLIQTTLVVAHVVGALGCHALARAMLFRPSN